MEKLKASLEAYMLSKSPLKTPTVQNVQALVLLAVVVEDKGYGLKFMTVCCLLFYMSFREDKN